ASPLPTRRSSDLGRGQARRPRHTEAGRLAHVGSRRRPMTAGATSSVDVREVGARVRAKLLGPDGDPLDRMSPPERRLRVRDEVMAILREDRAILPARTVTEVVNQLSDELDGLGPSERLLTHTER